MADELAEFRQAVAEDLRQLAVLHDREPDAALIAAIREVGFPDNLALRPVSEESEQSLQLMEDALDEMPQIPGKKDLDILAVDFADIYLTNALQASPYESVWLDEDGLVMQQPMFKIRDWYSQYGLAAEDWRTRSDDHLSLQLQFLAHLMGSVEGESKLLLEQAGKFMDEHLLLWLPDFASRIAHRCSTPYFAGVSLVTWSWCESFRDAIAEILQQPRPDLEAMKQEKAEKLAEAMAAAEQPYVPGVAPSW